MMGRAVVLGLGGPMGRAAAYYLSKYTENEVVASIYRPARWRGLDHLE